MTWAKCEICGEMFRKRQWNQKTCSKKCLRQMYKTMGKPEKEKELPKEDKCKSCRYKERYSGVTGCGYILITNHPRGCPPGALCTRYQR